jgi:hypothetical protein
MNCTRRQDGTGSQKSVFGFQKAARGDQVLRMFVTGGPPVRGGCGMPKRINTISRSSR